MNNGLSIIELSEKIETTEGWRISSKMHALDHSYAVFLGNNEELISVLEEFETDFDIALNVMNIKNRDSLKDFLGEVSRLFHNYLASAKTLIDHTRVFFQSEYTDTPFAKEYNTKIKEFFADVPLAKFIQDIRNFSLHRTLPITGAKMEFNKDGNFSHTININTNSLKEWAGWTAKAMQFLQECEESLNIRTVVNEYTTLVMDFQTWFRDRQFELHKVELEELDLLQEQLQGILNKDSVPE